MVNFTHCGSQDADLLDLLEQGLLGQRMRTLGQGLPEAGVLVAVTDHPDGPEVILTRRASRLSSHAGEVAFPGGKRDPDDASILETALRESHEEIGLPPAAVRVIGSLGQVVSKHGFLVTPFLGVISADTELVPNPDELESLFRVPLRFLLDPQELQLERLCFEGRVTHMPRYDYQGYVIWGLTAYVLVELLNQALGAELPLRLRPDIL
ncbi:MAG: 8-oxo-dGTP pyrophosphatase MutT (NUDIX family) [Motiliproteus sp.]|jgi:8-oxo-dGTP pyrophosphatase MutT (NUDIX family)